MAHTSTVAVGIDDSWQEHGAVDWAYDEARRTRSELRIVHVVDDRWGDLPYLDTTVGEHARDLVSQVREHLQNRESDVPIASGAVSGRPGPALIRAAVADRMLVVGRRGTGAFARLMLGSTSESAVNHADVPVVVVPDAWDTTEHRPAPVVAGIDPADGGDAAIEFACTVAGERAVAVVLVHIWEVPSIYAWDNALISGAEETWEREARELLDRSVDVWQQKHPDVEIRGELRHGHPVEGLLAAANAHDTQLLVVGGRRHNRLTGLVLGSVARGVLHHADRPVAVVHDVAHSAGAAV